MVARLVSDITTSFPLFLLRRVLMSASIAIALPICVHFLLLYANLTKTVNLQIAP